MLLHVVLEGLVFLMLGYQFFKIVLFAERQPFHQTDKELALEEPLLRSAWIVEINQFLVVGKAEGGLDHLKKTLLLALGQFGCIGDLHEALVEVNSDVLQRDDEAVFEFQSQ